MNVKSEELAKYYKQKYPLTFTKGTFKKEPFLAERYEAAWKIAKKAATVLKNNYGARRVVVFGSLTERSAFTRWSDIDLASRRCQAKNPTCPLAAYSSFRRLKVLP